MKELFSVWCLNADNKAADTCHCSCEKCIIIMIIINYSKVQINTNKITW